jgi:uncharacterized protein YcbK (DUF882 family)
MDGTAMGFCRLPFASSVLVLSTLAMAGAPAIAHADVQHTVARGHTLEAIANRYRVSAKSIMEANKLSERDVKRLKVGDVLTIPKVDPPAKAKTEGKDGKVTTKDGKKAKADLSATSATTGTPATSATFAAKPKTPGVIHLRRMATTEEQDIRIADPHGRVSSSALEKVQKLMRAPSGQSRAIEPRLVSLLGIVSNHFGSRKIEIVSGFRPFSPGQYTKHSNHTDGKAIDFRIVGVPNEAVRDFCRTLRNAGCGYYPNGMFVHMDVRDQSTYWVDYSKPGEPPRYNNANVEADEATSDVQDGERPAPEEDTTLPALPSSESPDSPSDAPAPSYGNE